MIEKRILFVVLVVVMGWTGYVFYKTQYHSNIRETQKASLLQKAADLKSQLDDLESTLESTLYNSQKYEYLKQEYKDLENKYKHKHPKMVSLLAQLKHLEPDYQKRDIAQSNREQIKKEYESVLKRYSLLQAENLGAIAQRTSIYFCIILFLLILGVVIFSLIDRRIYHPRHILNIHEQISLLGVTPALSQKDLKFPLPLHHYPTSAYSKSMTHIRNRLLGLPAQSKNILVVSMEETPGTISLVSNLAISLAQSQKRVLLVDCRFNAPRQHRYFKLPNRGLAELITQQNISDGLLKVEIPGLTVLPSGEGLSLKALLSEQFSGLLKTFKENYDFVFVDAPSFSLGTEAILIAQKTDGVIFTVPRGQVTQRTLKWAYTELVRHKISLLGVVLEEAPPLKIQAWDQFSSSGLGGRL